MSSAPRLNPWIPAVLLSGTLLCLPVCANGQTNRWSTHFDTSNSVVVPFPWGSPPPSIVWDGTADASSSPASGSARIAEHFTGADNEYLYALMTLLDASNNPVVVDASNLDRLQFDLRIAPGTAPTTNNDFGMLELGFVTTDWHYVPVGLFSLPLSATNWTHFNWVMLQHPVSLGLVSALYGMVWSGGAFTNNFTFNLDNIALEPEVCCPLPPTGPWLYPAIPGLNLTATAYGGENQSQGIATLLNSCSWVDAAGPVTYAVNIRSYPPFNPLDPALHEKFETHIHLVPDYNYLGDVAMLQILSDASGGAIACFRYKTNSLSSDFMLTNSDPALGPVGTLATLSAPTPTGEWSLGFLHNTNITITAPNGATTNFVMPAPAASHFGCPLRALFGIRPNTGYNLQNSAILSRVRIAGTAGDFDETFSSGSLDTNVWELSSSDAAGIKVVPPEGGFWLSWRSALQVQFTTNLLSGPWLDSGLQTNAAFMGPLWRALMPQSALSSASAGFWRLRLQ